MKKTIINLIYTNSFYKQVTRLSLTWFYFVFALKNLTETINFVLSFSSIRTMTSLNISDYKYFIMTGGHFVEWHIVENAIQSVRQNCKLATSSKS
jgi:hypothetical protein